MKIKLLKDHTTGKAGDVVTVADGMANYLIRCNVGVEYVEVKEAKTKPKKATKRKTKKKEDAQG